MAQEAIALKRALESILGTKNLPSHYADFEALTRDLVRELAPHAVIVDRKRYNELSRPHIEPAENLAAVTARYKAHNDAVESSMRNRGSIPPPRR